MITTATYEARALGVHSAMGMMKAAELAPDAVLLPVDFDAYRHYSRLFKAAVRAIAPPIEDRGIDEIYIDLTDVPTPAGGASALAQSRIKDAVSAATGLTCSIGVAPNKLLAKIASDLDKPDGLTVMRPTGISSAASGRCPRARSTASARSRAARLPRWASHTIGDLAAADPRRAGRAFRPQRTAHGCTTPRTASTRAVSSTHSEPKSISRETTFERDLSATRDRDDAVADLHRTVRRACERPAAQGLRRAGRSGVKLRYDNFKTVTRDRTIAVPTAGCGDDPPRRREVPEARRRSSGGSGCWAFASPA